MLETISQRIGITTNNVANTKPDCRLQKAKKMGGTTIEIRADSELMIRQLSGRYKINRRPQAALHRSDPITDEVRNRVFEAHPPANSTPKPINSQRRGEIGLLQ